MAICTFFQRGNCRNGDNCRFEHVNAQTREGNSFPTGNRFSVLQTTGQSSSQGHGRDANPAKPPYSLTREGIVIDLQNERPGWIFSAYGPGLHAPTQLFGGPMREQSFEEMRLHHYMGMAQGNPQAAVQQAEGLHREAEQQIQNTLQNVDAAIQYILSSENEHPNRLDICRQGTIAGQNSTIANPFSGSLNSTGTTNPFVGPAPAAASPFGQPSALGQTTNPFGNAVQAAPSPFGQPAALGPKSNPFGQPASAATPFGQPSALGQKSTPFGQPPAATPFGQPSVLGPKPNAFGAPSNNGFSVHADGANPFPSAQQTQGIGSFGSSQPNNPFGAAPLPAQPPNPFGAPQQPPQPFGTASPAPTNPFGATTQPASNGGFATQQPTVQNPFASPPVAIPNPFGAPSQPNTTNPFSSQSQEGVAQSNVTGTNPFGAPVPPAIVMGLSNTPNQATSFGAPPSPFSTQPANNNSNTGAGGITGAQSPYSPESHTQHPALSSYATKQPDGRMTMFKGKQVQYIYKDGSPAVRNRDGGYEKIWFPNGPPPYNKDTELPEAVCDDDIQKSYEFARATGTFKDGIIPLIPPKREWCLWDF